MSNQPKTPGAMDRASILKEANVTYSASAGAMVLVPREPTEGMLLAGYKTVAPDQLLVCAWQAMIDAAPAEQTPAVGGESEVMRFDIEPMSQDQWGMNKHAEGEYCRYEEAVAPLLAEIDQLRRAERNDAIAYRAAIEKQGELRGRIAELEEGDALKLQHRIDRMQKRLDELEVSSEVSRMVIYVLVVGYEDTFINAYLTRKEAERAAFEQCYDIWEIKEVAI